MMILCEILVAIVVAVLDFTFHLINLSVTSSWYAAKAKGIERTAYAITATTALHLCAALLLSVFVTDATILLTALFSWPVILLSTLLLLVSLVTPTALRAMSSDMQTSDTPPAPDAAPKPRLSRAREASQDMVTWGLSTVVSMSLVFGILSFISSQHERQTLGARLCEGIADRVDETWTNRAEKGVALAEKYLSQDMRGKLPCKDIELSR